MTNEQKQCLLRYLGYYKGNIDGVFGPASTQATKDFQKDYGLDADGIFGPLTEEKILEAITGKAQKADPFAGIRYFRKEEFKCKCGKHCDGYPAQVDKRLLQVADKVRAHFGVPAHVSSGVRCKTHNANVGGVANSRHLSGKAMDFRVEGIPATRVLEYVQQQAIRYAYAIDGSYIHMDVE